MVSICIYSAWIYADNVINWIVLLRLLNARCVSLKCQIGYSMTYISILEIGANIFSKPVPQKHPFLRHTKYTVMDDGKDGQKPVEVRSTA
jgi:hypothetical protein